MRAMLLMFVLVLAAAGRAGAQCPPVWQEVGSEAPQESQFAAGAFDQSRGCIVTYVTSPVPGTVEWMNGQWTFRAQWPSTRYDPVMAYDSTGSRTFLHGGYYSGTDVYSTLMAWSGSAWSQLSTNGPDRFQHAMCFDAGRNRLVIFGGSLRLTTQKLGGDTWEYSPIAGTWSLRTELGPEPRASSRMAYDAQRNVCVLYGGYGPDGLGGGVQFSDTWEYEGASGLWSRKQAQAPMGHRFSPALVYHRERGRTWLIGGSSQPSGVLLGDVWEWDGSNWTPLAATGLQPRVGHCAAYVDEDDSVLVWGGSAGSTPASRKVSRLVVPSAPTVATDPAPQTACFGLPLSLSVTAGLGDSLNYQWRRNAQDLPNTNSPTLTIPQCTMADAGDYDCVISNACGSATSNTATVRVLPDLRPSGTVDTADLTLFLLFYGFQGMTCPHFLYQLL